MNVRKGIVGRIAAFALWPLIMSAACGRPAHAAVVCVSNNVQLAIALSVAQNNGEDDYIELETGTYPLGGELDYIAGSGETYDLAISGGWLPGCALRATSGSTVLDGQNAVRPLYISANGRVSVYGLTIEHGNPSQYAGGGLNVSAPANTVIAIDYNTFVSNRAATNTGGAIYVYSAGTILMRNNLFLANQGTNTLYLVNDGIADLNNNTIVGNQLANHVGLGALDLAGSGQYYISNNLLWNNEGNDLYDQSGTTNFYNNDIGVRDGFPAASESNGLSVDPQFSGLFSLRPGLKSALINAGLDAPYGGIGSQDLGLGQRLIGKHVDIGAYESDVLFSSGFQ
jgi:predicted outer membrane repeat protein